MQHTNPYAAPQSELATTQDTQPNDAGVFSFSGRIGRLRYLAYCTAINFIFIIAAGVLGVVLSPFLDPTSFDSNSWSIGKIFLTIIGLAGYVALIVFGITYAVRRFNDLNRSGWFVLLFFIPLINIFIMLYMIFAPGTKGVNNYGAPPKPNHLGIYLGAIVPFAAIVGISAVAIPAYQDYTHKSKMAQQQIEAAMATE